MTLSKAENEGAGSGEAGTASTVLRILGEIGDLERQGYFDDVDRSFKSVADPPRATSTQEVAACFSAGAAAAARFGNQEFSDKPDGVPFLQSMSHPEISDRSEAHKVSAHREFGETVGGTQSLFGGFLRGEKVEASRVRHLVGQMLENLRKDRNLLLNLCGVICRDPEYLSDHSVKRCLFSMGLAAAAGFSENQILETGQGALLADVGMLLVPESIRQKPGKLNEGEFFEIRKHPVLGLGLVEGVEGLPELAKVVVYQHHERVSGDGYPNRRAGRLVSQFSRIVSLADTFTALISPRSHRQAAKPYEAMVSMLGLGGQGVLDAQQMRNFLRILSLFPVGSLVRLDSGRIAKVVASNAEDYTKPRVSVLTDFSGKPLPKEFIYTVDVDGVSERIVEALSADALSHHPLDGF